jgi:hypothetical protein
MSITPRHPAKHAPSMGRRPSGDRCQVHDGGGGRPALHILAAAAAAVSASLLYGCAPLSIKTPPAPSLNCNSAANCIVPVNVDCTSTPCTITVGYANVALHGFAVVWEIVEKSGQSYQFKNPSGVFFKTAGGTSAFNCHAQMNNKQYRCQGNRDGQTYVYGIELVGTPSVNPLDPWIVNN